MGEYNPRGGRLRFNNGVCIATHPVYIAKGARHMHASRSGGRTGSAYMQLGIRSGRRKSGSSHMSERVVA